MAPRWFQKMRSKMRSTTRPTSPVEPATTSPITPSKATSSCSGTSTQSLQERLWNQAYDELKVNESDVVEAYEKILSAELCRGDSASTDAASQKNEIEATPERRWCQMEQLIRAGLERTEKDTAVKQGIEDGLQAVRSVKGVVDKAVQAAPEAAIAWVGVCLALEILSNPITEPGINRRGIAYVVSKMDWYWNLADLLLDENRAETSFAGLRDQLEKHVVQLYQELLLYQMKSICLYQRKRVAVFFRDMFKLDDWGGQLSEIQDAEAAVRRDSKQYNTEQVRSHLRALANAADSQEMKLRDIHSAIRDQIARQEKVHQDEKDKECLKDMCVTDPRDDKTRIQQTKGGLLKDSYCWILDHGDFQRWRDDPQRRLLWIKGDPGKGKTMLLCGIIDELERNTSSHCLSYFFCQATEARLSNATAVLRGLIYLLVDQQPLLISHVRKKYDHRGKQLFEDGNAWEVMCKILKGMLNDSSLDTTILIIDALDECGTERPQLLDFIAQSSSSSRAKWIVSSRNWPSIEEKLDNTRQKVRLCLELNEESISAAVRIYIQHQVGQLAQLKKYDDKTRDAVEQHLISNANDTFLWVSLVCRELADEKVRKWHTLTKLTTFPPGLDSLYKRMMEHIYNLNDADLCKQILAIVSVVYRPVTLKELISLVELPRGFDDDLETLEGIIASCGSFLTLREGVVYFVHQSAKDFLLNKASDQIFPFGIEQEHHTIFSRSLQAMSRILQRDIYGLRAPGFPIEQVSPPDPDPLAPVRYSCIHWVDHLGDSDPGERLRQDDDLQDGGVVDAFIQGKYLYWLEALSLLHSMSEGIMAMQKLEALVRNMETRQLAGLLRDARRFILSHKKAVEISPLQVYASALVFSPARSLVRQLFKEEAPEWIISKPTMEADWNACVQTLEGHGSSVYSVAFTGDGRRLASASVDRTVKIWDAATGACVQTLEVGRPITRLSFDPITNSRLSTNIGVLNLDLPSAIDTQSTEASLGDASHHSYGISPDGMWIVKDAENMLWLPTEYRSSASAVAGSIVAIGCFTGRVLVMRFLANESDM